MILLFSENILFPINNRFILISDGRPHYPRKHHYNIEKRMMKDNMNENCGTNEPVVFFLNSALLKF